jgi:hypothetical protein
MKHMLKISAVYLIEKYEIPIHYADATRAHVEQALLSSLSNKKSTYELDFFFKYLWPSQFILTLMGQNND